MLDGETSTHLVKLINLAIELLFISMIAGFFADMADYVYKSKLVYRLFIVAAYLLVIATVLDIAYVGYLFVLLN